MNVTLHGEKRGKGKCTGMRAMTQHAKGVTIARICAYQKHITPKRLRVSQSWASLAREISQSEFTS